MITGATQPTWFQGVVEENNDPLGDGRVQVRVFGIHPPYDSNLVATEDLPWAMCLNGTFGAIHRVPDNGEWVMGLALDGRDHQNLIILGTIPGMQRSGPAGSSFAPNPYVKPSPDVIQKIGRPNLPPQMTGEDLTETPALIGGGLKLAASFKTPDHEGFDEPAFPMGDKPNKTTVWNASYNGSFLEINDDEEHGFINIAHASGAGVQIDSQGTIKLKTTGEMWNVSGNSQREFAGGRKDVVVDGGNYTLTITNGDLIINATGDIGISSHGNLNLSSAQKTTINAGEGVVIRGATVSIDAIADNIQLTAANQLVMDAVNEIASTTKKFVAIGTETAEVGSVGDLFLKSGGQTNMRGDGNFALDYSKVHLNSGESKNGPGTDSEINPIDLAEPPIAKTKTGVTMPGSTSNGSAFDIDDIEGSDADVL